MKLSNIITQNKISRHMYSSSTSLQSLSRGRVHDIMGDETLFVKTITGICNMYHTMHGFHRDASVT